MPQSNTRAAYQAMLPHATDLHRGSNVGAGRLRSVGVIRPAQTEMIPARLKPRERVHTARQFISKAEPCQKSSRGAVLVPSTCVWAILAGVAMRRHREARSSHLDSPDTMLTSAHRSEQCGYQRGRECLQSYWKPYLGPTSNIPGQSRRPRDLAALSRAPLPLPMTPGNYGVLLQKAVGGGMFEGLGQSLVSP